MKSPDETSRCGLISHPPTVVPHREFTPARFTHVDTHEFGQNQMIRSQDAPILPIVRKGQPRLELTLHNLGHLKLRIIQVHLSRSTPPTKRFCCRSLMEIRSLVPPDFPDGVKDRRPVKISVVMTTKRGGGGVLLCLTILLVRQVRRQQLCPMLQCGHPCCQPRVYLR